MTTSLTTGELTDRDFALRTFVLADASDVAKACRDPEIPRWTFMPEGLTVRRSVRGEGEVADLARSGTREMTNPMGEVAVATPWRCVVRHEDEVVVAVRSGLATLSADVRGCFQLSQEPHLRDPRQLSSV